MTRAVLLTFFGDYRGDGHPHESDKMMTIPLIILSGFAIVAGWANIPGVYTGFTKWVTTRKNYIVEYHPESFDLVAMFSGLTSDFWVLDLPTTSIKCQEMQLTAMKKLK